MWINFSGFFRNFEVAFSPNLPSVRKVNCRKTNKRKKNRRKGTVQERKHCCPSPTRLSGAKQARGGSQLPAAIIRPGPAKIDVCENLALCKGRVPSISLQVLCGSGCVKSKKFKEKHNKNMIFQQIFVGKIGKGINTMPGDTQSEEIE